MILLKARGTIVSRASEMLSISSQSSFKGRDLDDKRREAVHVKNPGPIQGPK